MQLTSLLLFVGVATALDIPTQVRRQPPTRVERDLATVSRVMTEVDSKIKDLSNTVSNFNGDLAGLASAASTLQTTLKQGTSDVMASTTISLNDAITLQSQVTALQGDANTLISALRGKKTAFQDASLCAIIYQQTGDLGSSSKALIDAVVAKVPQEVQSLAQQISSGFADTLVSTQADFAPGNCTNKGTAATPGTAAGTGTPAGAGTPAATGTGGLAAGGSSMATGKPVTAAAANFAAPAGLVFALAVASFLL